MKHGQLMVWWIPQVPMKGFEVLVDNLKEAKLLLETLAKYDDFQFKNHIKPDYCNTGGLLVWDDTLEPDAKGEKWTDWCDSNGMDFDEYCKTIWNG